MLVRVRSNVGIWRVDHLVEETATVSSVLSGIAVTRPHVVYETPLSFDPACQNPLDEIKTLASQGIRHGAMIHCRVDPSTCVDVTVPASDTAATSSAAAAPLSEMADATRPSQQQQQQQQQEAKLNMKRVIGADGSIRLEPTGQVTAKGQDRGFRKGMLPLRDMKMHWTLADFVALDSQFEFKIKRQENAICRQVSLDVASVNDFQVYLQRFQFQRKRFGFLYGKFVKEKEDDEKPTKAIVEAIYEPPQQVDQESAEGFVPLDDPLDDTVREIADLLGMVRVGWIFGHEAREKGFVLSAAEIIMTAEYQLEAADGVEETPFVTVTVSPKEDGTVSVEAFQVSQQCMAMVAEEALEIGPDPKFCNVNQTFTAIQEGKESPTVENNFFLTVVPIVQHTSETFVAEFPRLNRELDSRTPSHDELKRHLQKAGSAGWTFEDRLADFNLLIYLSKFLDVSADYPKICSSIVDRSVPLDDGYKLIIKSLCGMDTAY